MSRWEYLILQDMHTIHSPGKLDELGKEGWELIGFDSRSLAFFKRSLPPMPEKPAKRAAKPKV